jgi:hypothetical protein
MSHTPLPSAVFLFFNSLSGRGGRGRGRCVDKCFCRHVQMPIGNLPRVATLKRWAHLNFDIWLENKKSKDAGEANESEVWFPSKSKWCKEGVHKFFEFKENQGGNQGLSWIDPQSTLVFRLLDVFALMCLCLQ